MHRPHPPQAHRAPFLARALSLLVGLAFLAGCGTASGPSGLSSQGGSSTVSASSGGASSGATAVAKAPDLGDFVPLGPVEETAPRTESGHLKVLISLKNQASKADEAFVAAKGGAVQKRFHLVNAMAATIPESSVEALRNDPRVESVEPDVPVYLTGVELDSTWGVSRIGGGMVHTAGNKGAGIKVAIIDTGIDYNHADLNPNYAGGYDFVNNDADPMDDHGHGTHVAGTVAARADGTGVIGVAPEARLYGLKVLAANGSGSFSTVISALQWCVDNQIQVANLSLGGPSNPGTVVENAFNAAQTAGVVVVCAAGNSGTAAGTGDNVAYPARYNSVIAVAATDSADARAYFSSTGPKVEIAAPGYNIQSCAMGGGYVSMSGTSMASPHVAGAVALALKAGYTPSVVRQRLAQTALDLGTVGRDAKFGYGLVQVPQLVGQTNSAPTVAITAPVAGRSYPSGLAVTFTATSTDLQDGDLSAGIIWTVNGTTRTGATFTAVLPDGTYTITARSVDSGGLSGKTTCRFSVANAAPVVTITAPVTGTSYQFGDTITFTGTAADAEDGDVTANLVWTRGSTVIGTGGSFSLSTLPAGNLAIAASVIDSRGRKSAPATVRVLVGAPVMAVTVGCNKASYVSGETVTISVTASYRGTAVPSARAAVSITCPNGRRYVASGTTDTNGAATATFVLNTTRDGAGTYTVGFTGSKSGWVTGTATTTFTAQ